jgi:hypothetical protein
LHVIATETKTLHAFYDTHLRLWTAYVVDDNGCQDSPASYAMKKDDAVEDALWEYNNANA